MGSRVLKNEVVSKPEPISQKKVFKKTRGGYLKRFTNHMEIRYFSFRSIGALKRGLPVVLRAVQSWRGDWRTYIKVRVINTETREEWFYTSILCQPRSHLLFDEAMKINQVLDNYPELELKEYRLFCLKWRD